MKLHRLWEWGKQFGWESVRFVIIGIAATIVHYGVYYLLLGVPLSYNAAYTIGYGVSLVFNFIASVRFTFRTTFSAFKAVKFLASHGVNDLLHMALLNLFVWCGMPEALAPVPVLCIVVPINFFLVRSSLKNRPRKSTGHESES